MKINIDFPYETESYEFKTSLSELDKGIEAIAAMLNKHGRADVYFGVSNEGDAIGLKGQIGAETIKKVETRISEILKPTIIPSIILEDYDGNKVIHVNAKGNRKPYSSSGNYRIRVGSSNKKIEPELLGELFFDSEISSLESIESLNQELTFNTLKYFFIKNGLTINEENFYRNAGLKINGKFNMLAELLADENNTSIKVVRFSGLDKKKMLSRNEYGFKCLLVSMKEANDYVVSLNETRVDVESSLERKETKLFDTHAFEEAWSNACIHNKWVRSVPPAIYIFDNRLEIVSTGGLPFGYTKDDFYSGVSRPVNPGLFKIMGQLNLIEQTGHGNLVIVDKYGKDAFNINENFISVTIPFSFTPSMKQVDVDDLTFTQAKVLMALKENPMFTIKEVAVFCQLGTTRVSQVLKSLKEKGKLERIGSNKAGYWKVN
jgi:ATP-dependent DNA helicase RecG